MINKFSLPSSGAITRMTLLAFLSFRPMHGYELRKQIELSRRDRWADIKYGSIYGALRRLSGEGLLEEVGMARVGNRPPHTVYRTTEAGKEELSRLLKEAWVRPTPSARPMDTALSFVWLLPAGEVEGLIEERLAKIGEMAEELDSTQRWAEEQAEEHGLDLERGVRAMVSDLFEHSRRSIVAEREWAEYVLGRVRGGAYDLDEETMRAWDEQDGGDRG